MLGGLRFSIFASRQTQTGPVCSAANLNRLTVYRIRRLSLAVLKEFTPMFLKGKLMTTRSPQQNVLALRFVKSGNIYGEIIITLHLSSFNLLFFFPAS
jgi:hypothetical protein